MLTNEQGVQWGTESNTTMSWWPGRNIRTLQDLIRPNQFGWKTFEEQTLRRTRVTPNLHARMRSSIPWEAVPAPAPVLGQWLAPKAEDGSIRQVLQITHTGPLQATLYNKDITERLQLVEHQYHPIDQPLEEVRIVLCGGPKRAVLDFNPKEETDAEHTLWLWGNEWVRNLEWDPREWQWRRIGILAETTILNYSTKRGYRVALRQNNHTMRVDAELEASGYNSKARAKIFNRIWHIYLPRKVSAMQWLILTEGLPVGAWREKLGLPNECQLCIAPTIESLQHAFFECPEINRVWQLFRDTRHLTGLPSAYNTWTEICKGLMTEPAGPHIEEELKWDTAAAYMYSHGRNTMGHPPSTYSLGNLVPTGRPSIQTGSISSRDSPMECLEEYNVLCHGGV